MGDVTEANIERVLNRVESLGPKLDQCDADDKKILTVSFSDRVLTEYTDSKTSERISLHLLALVIVEAG